MIVCSIVIQQHSGSLHRRPGDGESVLLQEFFSTWVCLRQLFWLSIVKVKVTGIIKFVGSKKTTNLLH